MTSTAPLVLNVNDHVANLYMVSKMLRNAGFRVIEARTGTEALEQARNADARPEVIVLDVHLPDMSGLEVSRQLKSDPATRDIKILCTSATFVTSSNKLQGVEAGADGYLTQPFEIQDLTAAVRALLRLHATEIALVARNDALVAAGRRKDEFLAMLAHELRNPLAAIQLGLPLLERHPPRDEIEARTRAAMKRQAAQLTRLVDDLLDVSRVTRGKIELRQEVLDLVGLVSQVVDGCRQRMFEPRQQRLVVELPTKPVNVRGDAGRLEQVLTNLLDNASKYSNANTKTVLSLEAGEGDAVITITDEGVGVAEGTLPQIFDLFAQAETSLDRSRGGLGIGLTLVKALVEMHGGQIDAASDGLGRGTTMIVRIPQTHAAVVETPTAAPSPSSGALRVLVVDDNDDGREMMRLMCEAYGHTVVEAADGPEGVDRALETRPALAFVDIGLPTFDGYEVARRLRAELGRDVKLVALSGYGSAEHRDEALAAGFDEHIAKPIDAARLAELLASVSATAAERSDCT